MENIFVLWKKFSLSDCEGQKFLLQESVVKEEFFVAARFFRGRVLSMEAIAKTYKGFKVRDMGNHRVVFVFLDASDVEKVMMGEPWTFNKHLVSLQKVKKHTDVRRLEFVSTRFWVQVHDLPIGLNFFWMPRM